MCQIYKYVWMNGRGYVVYRDACPPRTDPLTHKIAVFVCSEEAADYCLYRNTEIAKNGSDAIHLIRHDAS